MDAAKFRNEVLQKSLRTLHLSLTFCLICSCSHSPTKSENEPSASMFGGHWQWRHYTLKGYTRGRKFGNRPKLECDEDRPENHKSSVSITVEPSEQGVSIHGELTCHEDKKPVFVDSFYFPNLVIRDHDILIDGGKAGMITSQILSVRVGARSIYLDFSTNYRLNYEYHVDDGTVYMQGEIELKSGDSI